MITSSIFLLIVAMVMFLCRAKLVWAHVLLGMFVAFLLLTTPVGDPLKDGAQQLAAALQRAGNGLLAELGVR